MLVEWVSGLYSWGPPLMSRLIRYIYIRLLVKFDFVTICYQEFELFFRSATN